MSDRTLALPDRALEGMVTNLLDATRRLENRGSWSGACRSAITTTPVGLPGSAITTVQSLTLSAGKWLLFGGLYTQDFAAAGVKVYTVNMWLNWPPGQLYKTTTTNDTYAEASSTNRTTVSASRRIKLTTSGAVTLTVQPISSVVTVAAAQSYLLAVPL